ncbi:uncharacterized protein BCN122_I2069 [Burkholderia cenocepacia]|nr:uncharacterized protein BCN122_I2069 [Burkholderia cenocepacia]
MPLDTRHQPFPDIGILERKHLLERFLGRPPVHANRSIVLIDHPRRKRA